MHLSLPTACVLLLLTSFVKAQSSVPANNLAPQYPTAMEFYKFAPFVDGQSNPLQVGALKADQADLDGDGNADLWFLGNGASGTEIAVQFANTAEVGRFHTKETLTATPFVSAATYRTTSSTSDQIIAINPNRDEPFLLHWNQHIQNGDPRNGYLGGSDSGWTTGLNGHEITTADHSGDGHDDIGILRDITGPGGTSPITEITLLKMGTQLYNFLWVEDRISISLGVELNMLRLADLNGDKQTDIVANAPGIGLVALRQSGNNFFIHGIWPAGGHTIRDIQIGDVDCNGQDDIAIVLDQGIGVILNHENHPSFISGFEYRAYLNPAQVSALHTCRIVQNDAANTCLLIGLPKDGKNYVIHPENSSAYGLTQAWVEPAPAGLTGPGVLGHSVVVADVDNDHDLDLVIQAPNASEWLTLRNPEVTFKPTAIDGLAGGTAPQGEGDIYTVTVTVPQALVDEGVQYAEVGFYVEDPSSNPNDPDYLYWGRLVPPINPITHEVSFTAYQWDEAPFVQQVLDFKANRHINGGHYYVYPPNHWETIRTGARMFLSVHGVSGGKRFESTPGTPPPPKKVGSTLGGKWVLTAKPPSLKGDVELLPWE